MRANDFGLQNAVVVAALITGDCILRLNHEPRPVASPSHRLVHPVADRDGPIALCVQILRCRRTTTGCGTGHYPRTGVAGHDHHLCLAGVQELQTVANRLAGLGWKFDPGRRGFRLRDAGGYRDFRPLLGIVPCPGTLPWPGPNQRRRTSQYGEFGVRPVHLAARWQTLGWENGSFRKSTSGGFARGSNWVEIAAGFESAVAIQSDGTLWRIRDTSDMAKSALTRTGRRSPERGFASRRSNKMGRSGSPLMRLILLPLLFVSEPTPIGWMSLRCLNDAHLRQARWEQMGLGRLSDRRPRTKVPGRRARTRFVGTWRELIGRSWLAVGI